MLFLIKSSLTCIINVKNINLNTLFMLMTLISSPYSHGHAIHAERISQNKSPREADTFTTISLDDEAYSIPPEAKHLKNQSKATSMRRKETLKTLGKNSHHLRSGNARKHSANDGDRLKHSLSVSISDVIPDEKSPSEKIEEKIHSHKSLEKNKKLKKKLRKRHFEGRNRYHRKAGESKRLSRRQYRGPIHRFVPTPPPEDANDFARNSNASENTDPLAAEQSGAKIRSSEPLSRSSPIWFEISKDLPNPFEGNRDSEDSLLHQSSVVRSSRNDTGSLVRSIVSWMPTIAPPVHTTTFSQVDVVQRNLPDSLQQPSDEKEAGADDSPTEESETDDDVVVFDVSCDHVDKQTCWLQREVGDVLTLAVRIESSKAPDSFQVRWMKVYHVFEEKKGKPLGVEPAKLPWNMVSGSEGRELRLNPVTNTDIDPNCFVAKVFLITKDRGKTLFTQLKTLTFRIDIPIVDMGKIYAGEELSINIENFISLPELGNLILDWRLEVKPHEFESLPSNVKVSKSGRSVILKELKKGRLGVLNCVIYSSNRIAVAKRRFNILKIVEDMKRRSTDLNVMQERDLLRSGRCRHILRRSQEKARKRFEEQTKPKSRKKRFGRRRSNSDPDREIDCEPLRKKAYTRWVRSFFEKFTSTDSRLMPLEKLFKLSDIGDGTLDDIIPHEVHFVEPKVLLAHGTSDEMTANDPFSVSCSTDMDCNKNAVCVTPRKQKDASIVKGHSNYCDCRPEYYGDGITCHKIPPPFHREKRLRRNNRNDFAVPQHLFYEPPGGIAVTTAESLEVEEVSEPPKVLAFEKEESFLLSNCIDDKDCSIHGSCTQPTNGHPYCKCRSGFRGNGIFCWETMDYVPPAESLLADEDINPRVPAAVLSPEDASMDRLAADRTDEAGELEDV